MAQLPDHYARLGVAAKATPREIERAYQARAAELRASRGEDAPEELAEVEEAYSVLRDPAKRARYDEELRKVQREADKKYAELDAQLPRQHRHHKHLDGTSGFLGTIWFMRKLFR